MYPEPTRAGVREPATASDGLHFLLKHRSSGTGDWLARLTPEGCTLGHHPPFIPKTGRNPDMSIRKREKWSDVLRQPPDPLRARTTWGDARPQIERMRLEVRQGKGILAERAEPELITETSSYRQYVDCRNKMCVRGGVHIADIVGRAVVTGQPVIDESAYCCGYEGSPKGSKRYKGCLFRFIVQGTTTYRKIDATPIQG